MNIENRRVSGSLTWVCWVRRFKVQRYKEKTGCVTTGRVVDRVRGHMMQGATVKIFC